MVRKKLTIKNGVIALLVSAGVLISLFFGLRVLGAVRHLHGMGFKSPPSPDQTIIRGWMTVPFIANNFHIAEQDLFAELGVPAEGNQHKSLADLNKQYAPEEPGLFVAKIQTLIQQQKDTRELDRPKL